MVTILIIVEQQGVSCKKKKYIWFALLQLLNLCMYYLNIFFNYYLYQPFKPCSRVLVENIWLWKEHYGNQFRAHISDCFYGHNIKQLCHFNDTTVKDWLNNRNEQSNRECLEQRFQKLYSQDSQRATRAARKNWEWGEKDF